VLTNDPGGGARRHGRQLSPSFFHRLSRIAKNWVAAIEGLPIPGIPRFRKGNDTLNHDLIVFGSIVL
jgi:hypothetical protein